jgi:hypothetical protein
MKWYIITRLATRSVRKKLELAWENGIKTGYDHRIVQFLGFIWRHISDGGGGCQL